MYCSSRCGNGLGSALHHDWISEEDHFLRVNHFPVTNKWVWIVTQYWWWWALKVCCQSYQHPYLRHSTSRKAQGKSTRCNGGKTTNQLWLVLRRMIDWLVCYPQPLPRRCYITTGTRYQRTRSYFIWRTRLSGIPTLQSNAFSLSTAQMALREKSSSMTVLEKGVEIQSDYVAEDMPDDNKSHSKAMNCRGLAWPNFLLCIIIGFVALLLALPLMVFFLPRDDELDVRCNFMVNYNFLYDWACTFTAVRFYSYTKSTFHSRDKASVSSSTPNSLQLNVPQCCFGC